MANSRPTIPTFYRLFFTVLDPIIALHATYMMFFTPAVVTDAFVPAATSPYNPSQAFFPQQLGGALLMCAVLDIFLLRRTHEIWIWKVVQIGQLLYDFALLYSVWYALAQRDCISLSGLRAEDWGTIAITGTCAGVRSFFCAGVWLPADEKAISKQI